MNPNPKVCVLKKIKAFSNSKWEGLLKTVEVDSETPEEYKKNVIHGFVPYDAYAERPYGRESALDRRCALLR